MKINSARPKRSVQTEQKIKENKEIEHLEELKGYYEVLFKKFSNWYKSRLSKTYLDILSGNEYLIKQATLERQNSVSGWYEGFWYSFYYNVLYKVSSHTINGVKACKPDFAIMRNMREDNLLTPEMCKRILDSIDFTDINVSGLNKVNTTIGQELNKMILPIIKMSSGKSFDRYKSSDAELEVYRDFENNCKELIIKSKPSDDEYDMLNNVEWYSDYVGKVISEDLFQLNKIVWDELSDTDSIRLCCGHRFDERWIEDYLIETIIQALKGHLKDVDLRLETKVMLSINYIGYAEDSKGRVIVDSYGRKSKVTKLEASLDQDTRIEIDHFVRLCEKSAGTMQDAYNIGLINAYQLLCKRIQLELPQARTGFIQVIDINNLFIRTPDEVNKDLGRAFMAMNTYIMQTGEQFQNLDVLYKLYGMKYHPYFIEKQRLVKVTRTRWELPKNVSFSDALEMKLMGGFKDEWITTYEAEVPYDELTEEEKIEQGIALNGTRNNTRV